MTIPALIRSPLVLWANSSKNALQDDWQSTGTIDSIRLTQGDTIAVELHWLKDVNQAGLVHDEVAWPAAANITLAVGLIDAAPSAGVFALSYGGQITSDIPFDATGADAAAKLNALSSIVSEGGVTVVRQANTYKVVWNNAGVLASSLAVATNDLLPACSIGTHLARAGAVNVSAIYTVHAKQSPVALCNTWEAAEPAQLTIAEESTIGAIRTWVLNFSKLPRGGSFTISYVWATGGKVGTTTAIEVDSLDSTNIIAAFIRGTNWNPIWFINSVKRSPLEYSVSIWISAFPVPPPVVASMSIANSNIVNFSTKVGLLSLNTMEVEALLAGQSSVDAVMEVEVELAGERLTIVQAQSYIVNDLIDTDVYELVQFGDVMPADSVVRYDTSQSLTTGQKLQARNNIGALGASSLDALVAKDAELELLISGGSLSTAELEAIQGAATPSATNLFITASAGSTAYAALSHSHAVSEVTGLQTTLDAMSNDLLGFLADVTDLQTDKANVYHTQAKSTITGLEAQLSAIELSVSGLAPIVHIHDTGDVTGLETRLASLELKTAYPLSQSDFNAIDLAESPSSTNVFVTTSRVNTILSTALSGLQYLTAEQVNSLISTVTNPIITSVGALSNSFDNTGLKYGSEGTIPYTGNLTSTNYPYELTIYIGSGVYKVPMRRSY